MWFPRRNCFDQDYGSGVDPTWLLWDKAYIMKALDEISFKISDCRLWYIKFMRNILFNSQSVETLDLIDNHFEPKVMRNEIII